VLFGITVTLASVDWVMSLEFRWFSTIFGVYNFAGLFFSGLAAVILLALWLERAGPLRGVLNESHLHDLGKLLFAFSVFWAYIWFSQYMLIWYTDIPEETSYFVPAPEDRLVPAIHPQHLPQLGDPIVVLLRRDTKRRTHYDRNRRGDCAAGPLAGCLSGSSRASSANHRHSGCGKSGLTLGGIGSFGLVLAAVLKARRQCQWPIPSSSRRSITRCRVHGSGSKVRKNQNP
jgi:hypothetical protein